MLGLDPLEVAYKAVRDEEERARRRHAQRRVDLYLDNSETILREEIARIFGEPVVRQRLDPFIRLGAAQSLFKRVVDEISRPVYSSPPTRYVTPQSEQMAFDVLARECRLNEKMDLACRLVNACNTVWLYYRYVARLERIVLEVLTPNMVTVIPDPDDPSRELALIYDCRKWVNGKWETIYVYWDDEISFRFNSERQRLLMPDPAPGSRAQLVDGGFTLLHGLGRLPFVSIHRRERWGGYWDSTSGNDLEAGQIATALLQTLVLKLHKSQGEKQIVVQGDIHGFPKDQVIDGEGALIAPEGTTVSILDLKTDAGHYLDTLREINKRVAANHGVNESRLEAKGGDLEREIGLLERRADLIRIFWQAEQDGFEVMKIVSPEHNRYQLSEESKIEIDFGEVHHRVDRKTQLELREKERHMGLRNILDDIREDNPEITTDDHAETELERNIEITSRWIERMRALNMAKTADAEMPGQSPEDNGRMGPLVRDGVMTRDEASDMAASGGSALRSIALRVLNGGRNAA